MLDTTPLRPELPPLPERMRDLPVDERGYPVPAFVAKVDGKWDFRIADSRFKEAALREDLCYVCGKPFTSRHRHYPIGPMGVINRITGEPPVHLECAMFSIGGCPFMVRAHAKQRKNGMPEESRAEEGLIERNPGVTALYSTRSRSVMRAGRYEGQYLLGLGDPEDVRWFAEGRPATYTEAVHSMYTGYPILIEEGEKQDREGKRVFALLELRRLTHQALPFLPKIGRNDETALGEVLGMGRLLGEAVGRIEEAARA